MYKNKIALGSAQFGMNYGISNNSGETDPSEVGRILKCCVENNIDSIDTAFAYGRSEEVLGNFDLTRFKIITKFTSQNSVEFQFSESTKRLKLRNIYAYLSHRPLAVRDKDWQFLIQLRESKQVKKIGFSFYEPSEIDEIIKRGFIPDIIQIPFNYLDKRFENKVKELKTTYNTEIHARSVYLQGLFFMDPKTLSPFFNPIRENLERIFNLENKAGCLLNHVISQHFIDKAVIGVNTLDHLKDNLNQLKNSAELQPITVDDSLISFINPLKWPK